MALILDRLQRELSSATDPAVRAEIVAQQAAYLARTGSSEAAQELISELRRSFGSGQNGAVTIWIMLAEAMVYHYGSLSPSALDRTIRAQFLSEVIRHRQLLVLTSAWRAEIEFERSKFEECFKSLESTLRVAESSDFAALSRVCNIVCKIAFLVGDRALAQRCFMAGREYALKEGDQASIEAFQYNRAAFRLSRMRSQSFFRALGTDEIKELKTEVASARNLQQLTRIEAFGAYIDLAEARLLVLDSKFTEAIAKLEDIRTLGPFPAGSLSNEMLDLELSYCLLKIGKTEESLSLFDAAKNIELSAFDADEVLAVRWIQRELFRSDSTFFLDGVDIDVEFDRAARSYEQMLSKFSAGLRPIGQILDSLGA